MKPVFVDVDSETCNIDVTKIETAITRRTRCIMPVHLLGLPCDMQKILAIAKKHGLKTLVDSCETMLVKVGDKSLGESGDIVCFSTYSAHLLTTGVGGLMITQNPEYATKMRSLMNHGRDTIYYNIDQDDNLSNSQKLFSMADRRFSFIDIGYSYRLTELEAALGIDELQNLAQHISARKKNARYFAEKLSFASTHLQLPTFDWTTKSACMMFPIIIRKNSLVKRSDLILHLEKNGVETRYLMPLLNQPAYKKVFGDIEKDYPVARWINENGFYIGCHQYLTKKELEHAVSVFQNYFR